ncbi:MAG: excalibur calcium-binding domain-containing protein [Candidatus Competibacteraceae bacterium]
MLSGPYAAEFGGRVVGISDGDTLTVQKLTMAMGARLAGIDAPEHDQPYGTAATRSLAALALNRTVRESGGGRGRLRPCGRGGGHGRSGSRCRAGTARGWRGLPSVCPITAVVCAEAEAKQARRGLWADLESDPAVGLVARGKISKPSPSPSASFRGAKRTCGEMASCEEARFYLDRCGVKRLDRDMDGVPCEALCR